MEASDEMGKRERRYPVLLYLLAIPLMIPVVRLALLAFPMIPRFYQGFLPFRYNSFYIDRGGPARTCETPGEGGDGDVVKGETSDNGWRRRDCGVQGMNGWSFWQAPFTASPPTTSQTASQEDLDHQICHVGDLTRI